jgi:hypothetical protein
MRLHRFIGRAWSSSSASSRSTPGMNRTRRSSNWLPRALLIYRSLASDGEKFVEMVVAPRRDRRGIFLKIGVRLLRSTCRRRASWSAAGNDPERTAGKNAIAAPTTSNGWIGGHDMKLPRPAPRYGRRSQAGGDREVGIPDERGFSACIGATTGICFPKPKIVKTRPKVGSTVDALLGGLGHDDSKPRRRL